MAVWLQEALGLDPLFARGVQLVIAFLFVLAAVLIVLALIRRRAGRQLDSVRAPQRRLGLVEAISVDDVRRLVLVRRDQVEHLLLIGGPNDVVVETSIARTAARQPAPAAAQQTPRAATAAPEPAAVSPAPSRPVTAEPPGPAAEPMPPPEPRSAAEARPVPEVRPAPDRPAAPQRPAPEPPAAEPRVRPTASLDVRPVRPTVAADVPPVAPRPPLREPASRAEPERPRPLDDVIRPDRR